MFCCGSSQGTQKLKNPPNLRPGSYFMFEDHLKLPEPFVWPSICLHSFGLERDGRTAARYARRAHGSRCSSPALWTPQAWCPAPPCPAGDEKLAEVERIFLGPPFVLGVCWKVPRHTWTLQRPMIFVGHIAQDCGMAPFVKGNLRVQVPLCSLKGNPRENNPFLWCPIF